MVQLHVIAIDSSMLKALHTLLALASSLLKLKRPSCRTYRGRLGSALGSEGTGTCMHGKRRKLKTCSTKAYPLLRFSRDPS